MPSVYKWQKDSSFKFQAAFLNPDVKHKIDSFMCKYFDYTSTTSDSISSVTDEALESFNDIIYTASTKSLKKVSKGRAKHEKCKRKKWFDSDLAKMRRELLRKSKLYSKFPNNPYIRGSFFKFRKMYSRCCKSKCKEFKACIINKLDCMYDNDPEAYWKLVKELKEEDPHNDPSLKISADNWLSHFSELFKIKEKSSSQDNYFENILDSSLDFRTFSELDTRISEKEVLLAIRNLKNNKSASLDGIKNEMLNASQSSTLPCIIKLFNLNLSSGLYPKKWKVGYITPLYKGDDPNNSTNYRGITVIPCLAKLFNSVLNNRLQNYLDTNKIIKPNQIGFSQKQEQLIICLF